MLAIIQTEWIVSRERWYRDKQSTQNAKNRVGNLTRIQPFGGSSVEHNNFSRDFKPVNFLPRNHRPISYTLTRYPLVRIARGVRLRFVFVLTKTDWRCAVSFGRAKTSSRDRLSFHTDYNKAAGKWEENPYRERSEPMRSSREKERIAFIVVLGPGGSKYSGREGKRREAGLESEKKSCGFSKKTGKQSPVRGTLVLHILNKYIIMPAVPSACFQPLPRCLPCTGRFLSLRERIITERKKLLLRATDKI